jgi:ACS family tartrate transporter-like MFS transporter
VVVLLVLTDKPEHAEWLADDERAWLIATLAREEAENAPRAHNNMWKGLTDWRVIVLSFAYFGTAAGLYAVSIWGPLIMAQFKLTNIQIGLLTGVPGVGAIVAMIVWSWNSDRTGERVWHTAIACLVAAGGLFYAGLAVTAVGALIALILVNVGVNSTKGPIWSLPTLFLSGPAAAAGIATINAVGNIGGFIGPFMIGWLKDVTGSFAGGLYFTGATLVLSAVLVLLLAWVQGKSPLAGAPAGQ